MYAVLRIDSEDKLEVWEWWENAANALAHSTACNKLEDGFVYRAVYCTYNMFSSLTNEPLHFS